MSSITLQDYAGPYINHADWNEARQANAAKLLERANRLLAILQADITIEKSPHTLTYLSGPNAGFRPQDCKIGASKSNHKMGLALDLYDPLGLIDCWCLMNRPHLETIGIWLESPLHTPGWSHWQSVSPASGNRFFVP